MPYAGEVRRSIQSLASADSPRTRWFDTDDLSPWEQDPIHLNSQAQMAIGRRAAEAARGLVCCPPCVRGAAALAAD